MEAACPSCKQLFTPISGGREPMVISCGDSICNECLTQASISYSFICAKCGITIEFQNHSFPVNRLYYQMQSMFNDYRKKKDYYESPSLSKGPDDELSRQHIKYDQKCMNPFCMRPKYQSDGAVELFCSIACKNQHEEMYVD